MKRASIRGILAIVLLSMLTIVLPSACAFQTRFTRISQHHHIRRSCLSSIHPSLLPYAIKRATTTTELSNTVSTKAVEAASHAVRQRPSKSTVIAWVLAFLLLRKWWDDLPNWLRKLALFPYKRFVATPFRKLKSRFFRNKQQQSSSTAEPVEEESLFMDDIDDIGTASMVRKVQNVMALAQSATDSAVTNTTGLQMQVALLAMLQMVDLSKKQTAELWDNFHESSGDPLFATSTTDATTDSSSKNRTNLLNTWIDQLHLSDWAYLEETAEIREMLRQQSVNSTNTTSTPYNWHLIRHVKANEPGRVGHYLAMDSDAKVALIAVKGTSELSDFVTDACGVPARYNVTEYNENGEPESKRTISCHEGILDASVALAADLQPLVENLFLPAGFRILMLGHSLGAGVASGTSVLLRARIPALRQPAGNNKDGATLLEVVAFAPPPTLSYQASMATSSFTTSIVNNDDMIPRCSIPNLVSLLRFVAIVDKRLEERIQAKGTVQLLKKILLDSNETSQIMTGQEIFDGMNEARGEGSGSNRTEIIQDMDHLFVPGKVVFLFEKLEPKEGEAEETVEVPPPEESAAADEMLSDQKQEEKTLSSILSNVFSKKEEDDKEPENIAAGAVVADGATPVLRHINVNQRMVTDHMPDAYEKTLRALLMSDESVKNATAS